jgi:uncharacterized protein (TIGR02594 family)
MLIPTWLDFALAELGQLEVPGAGSNPRILDYLATTTIGDAGGDTTPWCAAFTGWCLERGGQPSTRSAAALSYATYGDRLTIPVLGCIAVLSREGGGHVGFYLDSHHNSVYLVSGNQGDRVSVASFFPDRILSYRWPA